MRFKGGLGSQLFCSAVRRVAVNGAEQEEKNKQAVKIHRN